MFGFTEEQIAWFGLTFGVGAFMLYMLFIIGQLAWESMAGIWGTFVVFLAGALGLRGFIAMGVILCIIYMLVAWPCPRAPTQNPCE